MVSPDVLGSGHFTWSHWMSRNGSMENVVLFMNLANAMAPTFGWRRSGTPTAKCPMFLRHFRKPLKATRLPLKIGHKRLSRKWIKSHIQMFLATSTYELAIQNSSNSTRRTFSNKKRRVKSVDFPGWPRTLPLSALWRHGWHWPRQNTSRDIHPSPWVEKSQQQWSKLVVKLPWFR